MVILAALGRWRTDGDNEHEALCGVPGINACRVSGVCYLFA